MKKIINIEKRVDFPTMIGEVCAISLDQDLKPIDSSTISGDLILSGKYKMIEAQVSEEDFEYKFPIEINLIEKIDLSTLIIEIKDFYYEIENDDIMICNIELEVNALELIDLDDDIFEEDRECDGDSKDTKEIEIPVKEDVVIDKEVEIDKNSIIDNNSSMINSDENQENDREEIENDSNDEYGTFIVYTIRENESINVILEKYKTSIEELEKYNDIKNINNGVKLIIPIINEQD